MDPNTQDQHEVYASNFASAGDYQRYQFWFSRFKTRGMSDEQADLKAAAHGDNCIGYNGTRTGPAVMVPMCALPPERWHVWGPHKAQSDGKLVRVTDIETGLAVICEHRDSMPAEAVALEDNGCTIDLNPGALAAFVKLGAKGFVEPLKRHVIWQWESPLPKPQEEPPKPVSAPAAPIPVIAAASLPTQAAVKETVAPHDNAPDEKPVVKPAEETVV